MPACCRPSGLLISRSLQALHSRWAECCGSRASESDAGKERLKELPSLEHLGFCMWCVYHRHRGGSREQKQSIAGASPVPGTAPSRWGRLQVWSMSEDMLTALLIQGGKGTRNTRSTNRSHSERNDILKKKPKAGSKLLRGGKSGAEQKVKTPTRMQAG